MTTPGIAELVVTALATWQVVEVWHHSALFAGRRAVVEARGGFLADLLLCPFCLSVWAAAAVCAVVVSPVPEAAWAAWAAGAAKLFVLAMAVSRLANLGNDLAHTRCRTPRVKTGFEGDDVGDQTGRGPGDTGPAADVRPEGL